MALTEKQKIHFNAVLCNKVNEINFEGFIFSQEEWFKLILYLQNENIKKYITKISLKELDFDFYGNPADYALIYEKIVCFEGPLTDGSFSGLTYVNLSEVFIEASSFRGFLISLFTKHQNLETLDLSGNRNISASQLKEFLASVIKDIAGVKTKIILPDGQMINLDNSANQHNQTGVPTASGSMSAVDDSQYALSKSNHGKDSSTLNNFNKGDGSNYKTSINCSSLGWTLFGVALMGGGVALGVVGVLGLLGTMGLSTLPSAGLCAVGGALIGSSIAIFTRVSAHAISDKFSTDRDDDEPKPDRSSLYWSLFGMALIGAGAAFAVVGVLSLIGTLGLSSLVSAGLLSGGAALIATGTTIFAGLAKDKCLDALDDWQKGRSYQLISAK